MSARVPIAPGSPTLLSPHDEPRPSPGRRARAAHALAVAMSVAFLVAACDEAEEDARDADSNASASSTGGGVDGPEAFVVGSNPTEGEVAVPTSTTSIVVDFDVPMSGADALLRTGGKEAPLSPTWDTTRTSATFAVGGLLVDDEQAQLELRGFAPEGGGTLDTSRAFGDATLDFLVGARPVLDSSVPAEDAVDVYPAPFDGRFVITLGFSEPMRAQEVELALRSDEDASTHELPVTWAEDGRSAMVEILGDVLTGAPPLRDDTTYHLDVPVLADAAGNPMEAAVSVSFRTGHFDPLLNHSCGHTEFGPFGDAVATSDAASAPWTGTGHVRYTITLPPQDDAFGGFTTFGAGAGDTVDLFFDVDVPLELGALSDGGEDLAPLATTPAAPACSGIAHRARISLEEEADFLLALGPTSMSSIHMIVEITGAQ